MSLTETANRKYEFAPAKSFAITTQTNERKQRSAGISRESMILLIVEPSRKTAF